MHNQLVWKLSEKTKPLEVAVLIGIGSNLDPERNISAAISLLEGKVQLLEKASIWQSAAVGHNGPDYLNTAILIGSVLPLTKLQNEILSPIEDHLGRVRGPEKYMDRTIDLDVLLYDQKIIDDEIWTQPHATLPAAEILPDLHNPKTGLTLKQTARKLLSETEILIRRDL